LRYLLLIFPNTFEYFFIFYEALSLRYNPARIDKMKLVAATALIWIFIKLPQEFWIHIAKMDVTDYIRANPLAIILVFALAAVLIIAVSSLLKGQSPSIICLSLAVNAIPSSFSGRIRLNATRYLTSRYINSALVEKVVLISLECIIDNTSTDAKHSLVEKVVLISLECIIFAQLLPGVQAESFQIATAVAFVIIINTALSLWLAGKGASWRSTIQEFLLMSAVNFLLFLLFYHFLQYRINGLREVEATLFFALLLTLNVTLYDRYWKMYMLRTHKSDGQQ